MSMDTKSLFESKYRCCQLVEIPVFILLGNFIISRSINIIIYCIIMGSLCVFIPQTLFNYLTMSVPDECNFRNMFCTPPRYILILLKVTLSTIIHLFYIFTFQLLVTHEITDTWSIALITDTQSIALQVDYQSRRRLLTLGRQLCRWTISHAGDY